MYVLARVLSAVAVFVPLLPGQQPLSLRDAVAQALSGNPTIAGASARVSVAEGLRDQAGLRPNPRLVLQSENARAWGNPPFSYSQDSDTFAYLEQRLETGGKRYHRLEIANQAIRRSQAEEELQRHQIASRVSAAYWMAAGAARARKLLQQEVSTFDTVVQFHRDRVREGAAAEVDLIRVEVERDRLSAAARTAAHDAERARIVLFREMGKSDFPLVEFVDDVEVFPEVSLSKLDQVLDKRLEMKVARQTIEHSLANQRLQQANARPDPDVQVGYKRTAGFNTLYAAVQVPLPFTNRNQGQIAAAAAETTGAKANLAAAEALIRADFENAKADYGYRQQLLEETLRPMRARAEEVYRIEMAAYREGGSNILRLLDAERSRIESLVVYTRAVSEYQQSASALKAAQGKLP